MAQHQIKWLYLIILALMWGSSFILIKKGVEGLTAIQVGTFRVLIGAIILIIVGFNRLKKIKRADWKWLAISGFIGTFFPSILFAYAMTEIDSAVASILNSTVPLLALVVGVLFYKSRFQRSQFLGIIIGFIGCIVLIMIGANINQNQNYWYSALPVIASLMYAFNANIIKSHLQYLSAFAIAAGSFIIILPPTLVVLISSGFFDMNYLSQPEIQTSMLYIVLLAVFGTAVAKILFNRLIQLSDPVFSTSVTYLIPIVALFWGILDNESFSLWQLVAGAIILVGVYVSNLKRLK